MFFYAALLFILTPLASAGSLRIGKVSSDVTKPFTFAAKGTSTCSSGFQVADTLKDCEAGAAALGWSATKAQSVSNPAFPSGCFKCEMPACYTKEALYLNTKENSAHTGNKGWTSLCVDQSFSSDVTKPFTFAAKDTSTCSSGYQVADTLKDCEAGAAALGWSATNAQSVSNPIFPSGCFKCQYPRCYKKEALYFNAKQHEHAFVNPNACVAGSGKTFAGNSLSGKDLCCPANWIKYGDGSACKPADGSSGFCFTYGNDLGSACPHPCGSTMKAAGVTSFKCNGVDVTDAPGSGTQKGWTSICVDQSASAAKTFNIKNGKATIVTHDHVRCLCFFSFPCFASEN